MRPVAEVEFVGGHLALDFVNTADARDDGDPGNALESPEDLRTWGRRQGVLDGAGRAGGAERQELRRAVAARELLYRLFTVRLNGRAPGAEDLAELSRLVAAAHQAGRLEPDADGRLGWSWPRDELSSVRHAVAHAASELLAGAPEGRLKQCPGERCGWLFLDTTKRGNRRWCSMQECGTDAKLARRRMRQSAAG